MAREKLGEILIKAGVLDQVGLQRALNEQQRWGGQLGRYLVELGLITEEMLIRALSTQYKLPAVALDPPKLNIGTGRLIPKEICENHNLICFRADLSKRFIDVAMSDPSNPDTIDEVRVATQYNVRPYIAAPSVIERAIRFVFYGDMALGADLDLSPDSTLRIDPRGSDLLKPRGGGPPSVYPPPRRDDPVRPLLEVQVTPSSTDGNPLQEREVTFPPLATGENFHITLDVPPVDKAALARSRPSLEDRLSLFEATLTRNSAIVQMLLDVLLKKGIISQGDILRILQKP
jgi:hypothetical protein